MSDLSASSASVRSVVSMSNLSAPSTSALSTHAGSAMLVHGLYVPSAFAISTSTSSTTASSALALSTSFGSAMPMLGFFSSVTLVFESSALFISIVIPIPGRQKLIKLNLREKRATSKDLAPALITLLLSKPLLLFLASHISKKRSINKAFDINYQLLANNQFGEDVDQSFIGC